MITTEYKGYSIYFNENLDEWCCRDLDDLKSSNSLLSLKRSIDAIIRKEKSNNTIDVISIEYGSPSRKYGKANEFVGLRRGNASVAVMLKKHGAKISTRNIFNINDLAVDTPENRALIERAFEHERKAQQHKEESRQIIKSIPRLTIYHAMELTNLIGENGT